MNPLGLGMMPSNLDIPHIPRKRLGALFRVRGIAILGFGVGPVKSRLPGVWTPDYPGGYVEGPGFPGDYVEVP